MVDSLRLLASHFIMHLPASFGSLFSHHLLLARARVILLLFDQRLDGPGLGFMLVILIVEQVLRHLLLFFCLAHVLPDVVLVRLLIIHDLSLLLLALGLVE